MALRNIKEKLKTYFRSAGFLGDALFILQFVVIFALQGVWPLLVNLCWILSIAYIGYRQMRLGWRGYGKLVLPYRLSAQYRSA